MPWTVIVPLKPVASAKSRLRAELGPVEALALAFAIDTVRAAAAAHEVGHLLVVSSDPVHADALADLRAELRADPGGGLNAALAATAAAVVGPVAALTGDLPALTADGLDAALTAAAAHPLAVVPDRAGTGTALLTALDASRFAPAFGIGSRERHERAGHVVLPVPVDAPIRADVDTRADLGHVLRLGVGQATAAAVAGFAPLH